MIRYFARLLIGGVSAVAMFGCGGGGDDAPQEPPPDPNALNFARITREVMTPHCGGAACHTGPAAGFKMGTNNELYANLVNVKATGAGCATSGYDRIVPGDPDNSLVYLKIGVTPPPCGDQMPIDKLDATKIELVRSWIEAGAPKD
jgi:hypothetical protein